MSVLATRANKYYVFSTYLPLISVKFSLEQFHMIVTVSSVKLRPNQTLHPRPGLAGRVAAFYMYL